jgi:asparagine synthase (glutamine-hydrolysing)
MCRIAGVLNKRISPSELEDTVTQMCELLKHGGPDDGGIFIEATSNLVLGNRRLSLLDLSAAGHQPMQYQNRYTITYNGELYNFKTLKTELQQLGLQFTTGTDTEVILAAFSIWNTQSFARLNGMFAFALWDAQEKLLYLVRDAVGIKPLYFSTASNGLVFASEMRAFVPVNYLQQKNKDASIFQLAYGFIPEPITTMENVKPLPKGCYLTYNANTDTHNIQSFSFFSFSSTIKNEEDATSKIYESIDDAVQRQMVADAPVGLFLSGGIDSTILANLAAQKKEKDLHTLSIYFDETKYSEKKYQDIVAQELKSTHHAFLLKEENFHENFEAIIADMDMPSCDGINTWFISKFAAAEGLKAVLSGVGADEMFGGYPSFGRINKALLLQNLPSGALQIAMKANQNKISRLSYLQIDGVQGLYLFLRGHFTPRQIAEQLGANEKEVWNTLQSKIASPSFNTLSDKNKASWLEFNIYMQNQLLKDADVMSMAHGLEIRVPFLDNEVVHTAFGIADKIKYNGKLPKQLLINTFQNNLPREIWDRPKMGFSFPFAEWMHNSVYVKELSNSNNANTRKACKDFTDGKLHWSRMMSLIMVKDDLQ